MSRLLLCLYGNHLTHLIGSLFSHRMLVRRNKLVQLLFIINLSFNQLRPSLIHCQYYFYRKPGVKETSPQLTPFGTTL